MTNSKLQPGMLTYDDGRSYEEQCREIAGNASGQREVVLGKDVMEAIFKSLSPAIHKWGRELNSQGVPRRNGKL